ncbi:GTP pyrophosphokinase [Geomesophilobacter sediminis]|uniref:(P)ppGpp synthetase n=1 Tax=Geomesophilobacter sediminis TaxID=2798584 RepID=A0A8J7SCJ1_9BACT|nr:(p)ppGpp synthetase [Geomesophilobacter sediminis]MBJ6727214.1 (p)ppGpp synthetase [Geomesophilobacter sediminis]
MHSLDFEMEKTAFRKFYESDYKKFTAAKNLYIRMINGLLKPLDVAEVTKIEGRVKDKEECIRKFHRKYLMQLEADEQPYQIKDFISDLIAVRVVCLYNDQISAVSEVLHRHFKILDVTDKISAVENTEDSFGYRGLHLDLALSDEMAALPKYRAYRDLSFEVQIRSLVQDAWSVLDHKIKYKKSIPVNLKRRITVLSALFELADREFQEIRNATRDLLLEATVAPVSDGPDAGGDTVGEAATTASVKTVNAFSFLRVVGHFFRDFAFEADKVDTFVQDILELHSGFEKSDLHRCLNENLKLVKDYRVLFLAENPEKTFGPYTTIRHCLYLSDPETFRSILNRGPRERFSAWLKVPGKPQPEADTAAKAG